MIYFLIMIGAGMCSSAYSAIGATLGGAMGIFPGSLVTFVASLVTALIIRIFAQKGSFKEIKNIPKWTLTGGALAVIMSVLCILVTINIGVTALSISLVFGNLVFSMVMDHFGMLGVPIIKITKNRVIGIAVMIIGLAVVNIKAFL